MQRSNLFLLNTNMYVRVYAGSQSEIIALSASCKPIGKQRGKGSVFKKQLSLPPFAFECNSVIALMQNKKEYTNSWRIELAKGLFYRK